MGIREERISSFADVEDLVDNLEAFPGIHTVALEWCSGADTTGCVFGKIQKCTDARLRLSM
jgi:hypothetical protein